MSDQSREIEMTVVGLLMDPQTNSPIVILKDTNSSICLPIWIGFPEATAIASALKKLSLNRPMTHDLLRDVIDQLGGKVIKIVISALEENTYLANVEIATGDTLHIIDARPSDAIALAVRTISPIYVSSSVLEKAKVTLVAVSTAEGDEEYEFRNPGELGTEENPEGGGIGHNFSVIEKDKWAEILASMDPDDFKYKM